MNYDELLRVLNAEIREKVDVNKIQLDYPRQSHRPLATPPTLPSASEVIDQPRYEVFDGIYLLL